MAKNLNMTLIFDFYGNMLTEKQREILDLYYNNDLSLGEISEQLGITRQGVHDSIKRSERQLTELEKVLGITEKFLEISDKVKKMEKSAERLETIADDEGIKEVAFLKQTMKDILDLL